ncbi:MAG TPA: four helix bundle protein [Bacteroidales bacterium]|nr:four helix bundle protein [Bacteroidales bacterium]
METLNKKPISSFKDLIVYQNTYEAMLKVMKEVIPKLPDCEKYDLKDQLSRSCKAIPRLIAEGYAKRQQKAGFRKYLEDSMAECNETMVSLMQTRDIYNIDSQFINSLIETYDISGRQLYMLAEKWRTFERK